MTELTLPVGRLVSGHPMVSHPVKDDKTNLPRLMSDNTPMVNFYCGVAIQKGAETHWNQTAWGQQIYAIALAAWPNGEHAQGAFSWKVEDGDSAIPNKKMKKNCDREGYPGHWIVHASNMFPFPSYHRGRYSPQEAIQRKEEIKTGDYCRLIIDVSGNDAKPGNTAGIYVNLRSFELYQAGIEIVSVNQVDAQAGFGEVAAQLPAGALVDPNVPATTSMPDIPAAVTQLPGNVSAPPPTPHTEILAPPPVTKYLHEGQQYTHEQLVGFGWNEQQIATLQTV